MPDDPDAIYDGKSVPSPLVSQTLKQQLDTLDWHPLFTGRCPKCEMAWLQTEHPKDCCGCKYCGWPASQAT